MKDKIKVPNWIKKRVKADLKSLVTGKRKNELAEILGSNSQVGAR